jgi:hypothetical protein
MATRRFNAGPSYGYSGVDALNVAFSIFTDIDSKFYDVKYPGYENQDWHKERNIRTGSEGATSYSYITRDTRGAAKFLGNGIHTDLPLVGQSIATVEVPVGYTGVSAAITNEDARQYQHGEISSDSLAGDLAAIMRRAIDNLFEMTFFFGAQVPKMYGILNNPNVILTATPDFMAMTIQDLVSSINGMITSMWQETNGLFLPTNIYLPYDVYGKIAGPEPMVVGTTPLAITPLQYLIQSNVATQIRQGTPLIVLPSRYLSNAGLSGSRRIVAIDMTNGDSMVIPMPMPYVLSQPVPHTLSAVIAAEAKFGSPHLRFPGSVRYLDDSL